MCNNAAPGSSPCPECQARPKNFFQRLGQAIKTTIARICDWFTCTKSHQDVEACCCLAHCGLPPHCGFPPHCACAPHCGYPPHCNFPPHCGWCPRETPCDAINRVVGTVIATISFGSLRGRDAIEDALKWLSRKFGLNATIAIEECVSPFSVRQKVAFVSVYGTPCGIATYNQDLLFELRKHADITVLAEYANDARDTRLVTDPEWVIRCWNRHEHPKRELIREIEKLNPDIVHFSHEYGFFPKAYYYTGLVSALKMRGFKVVATMHSIYEHLDKTVQEASADRLIAHSVEGMRCLGRKGIPINKVTVVPHGSNIFEGTTEEPSLLAPLWNTWGSDHTLFQPGFLFGYKGHLRMLKIVARLKAKYPDVQYIIQGSENPNTMQEHDWLYNEISRIVAELGIEENVTVNRGFVPIELLLNHIRTVKVVVLPYASHPDHDVRATSGIARMVLATETPLVVSHVHLFDDLDGICPRAKNDDDFYTEIDRIFSDPSAREEQIRSRRTFLQNTSWPRVAEQVAEVYADASRRK